MCSLVVVGVLEDNFINPETDLPKTVDGIKLRVDQSLYGDSSVYTAKAKWGTDDVFLKCGTANADVKKEIDALNVNTLRRRVLLKHTLMDITYTRE
jgi:hypothetical protein